MCPCPKFVKQRVKGTREGVWKWPAKDGLRLRNAGDALTGNGGRYTFVMLVNLDTVDGFRKLIDFDNLQSDSGLYVDDKTLYPYDLNYSGEVIHAGHWYQIAMTRNRHAKVSGFVEGNFMVSAPDPGKEEVLGPDDYLHFLIDDGNGSG